MSFGAGIQFTGIPLGAPPISGAVVVLAVNGLSKNPANTVVLGQDVGEVGDPAVLLSDREIPANGFRIGLTQDTALGSFTQIRFDDLVANLAFSLLFAGSGFGNSGMLLTYDNFGAGNTAQIAFGNDGTLFLVGTGPAAGFPQIILNGRTAAEMISSQQTANFLSSNFSSRTMFNNAGAAGLITCTLQPAGAGQEFGFCVENANGIAITATGGASIIVDTLNSGPDGTVTSVTAGSFVRLLAINNTTWFAIATHGTWV